MPNEKPVARPSPLTVPATLPRSARRSERRLRRRGAMALCLALCASSCAQQPPVAPPPEIIQIRPPAGLTEPTHLPGCDPTANRELVACLFELVSAVHECNADKAAQRTWAAGATTGANTGQSPSKR